jgi:hypothetical protein
MNPVKRFSDDVSFSSENEQPPKRQKAKATKVALASLSEASQEEAPLPLKGKKIKRTSQLEELETLKGETALRERRTGVFMLVYKNGSMYVGEVEEGHYHGQGAYFINEGQLVYEGGYRDGLCHGPGIAYNEEGEVEFDGIWVEGLRYIGETKNKRPHGQGVTFYSDKRVHYSGGWKKGLRHGKGELYYSWLCYKGLFKNDLRDGFGRTWDGDGNLLSAGKWKAGRLIENDE